MALILFKMVSSGTKIESGLALIFTFKQNFWPHYTLVLLGAILAMKSHIRELNIFLSGQNSNFVKEFVAQCTVCQQTKSKIVPYPSLLAPLPIPKGAWQTVTLDFIEGLPRSAGSNCILVVVDKFSK